MKQRSIKQDISIFGIGLHSGKQVNLTLKPAPVNSGIVFIRTDLKNRPQIKSVGFNVCETTLCTVVGDLTQNLKIGTVEHLLSALFAFGIDNLVIEVDAEELPVLDGSSAPFMKLLDDKILEQNAPKRFIKILKPITVSDDAEGKTASLKPYNGFKVNFEIFFDHPVFLKQEQSAEFEFSTQSYANEVCQARTFGFMRDIEYMKKNNLGLGGSLENAVVIDEDKILNPEGLRYKDEFVKHKVLDAIGDLFLAGGNIIGEYSGYKSGHALNNKLVRKLLQTPDAWEWIEFSDTDCPLQFD